MRRLWCLLAVVPLVFVAPAHADPEIDTITCTGSVVDFAPHEPGERTWTGGISCSLGTASPLGFETTRSFTSDVSGLVDVTAVGPVTRFVGTLRFAEPSRSYSLEFDDFAAVDDIPLANPDDTVFASSPYEPFHVRAGYILSTPCVDCGPAGASCEWSETCIARGIRFVAEYLYDLPVSRDAAS